MTLDKLKQLAIAAKAQGNVVVLDAPELLKVFGRIEQLERENAAIEKRLQEIQRMCLGYQEEHAGLRKDAERYRWLRDQNADLEAGFYVGDETDALPGDIDWVGSDLDVAIDRAMKEQT